MNKLTLFRKISLLSGSFISLVISLVLYIKSYSFYSDEWGTDISFNEDYSVAFVFSLILSAYFLYSLVCSIKKEEPMFTEWAGLASSGLASFYPLGKFFKALFKAINKGNEFNYAGYQAYLYIGLVVLSIFLYFLFIVIEKHLKKKETTE